MSEPEHAQKKEAYIGSELIPIINRLQDIFAVTGGQIGSKAAHASSLTLELPQIVVVGSQSSGKSSVLEAIVGRDFLPRGSGIVTRRPLVLQLFRNAEGDASEWGEFVHKPGERFTNFAEIRREIERDTERLTGQGKGISDVPINLKVHSPTVVDLTLVDLPGMTRVPVGDQPADIEQQIRAMIMRYIEPKNAIILAVTAANSDVANSDAMRLARDVDPGGDRTLGVLTKIDIMDAGTNALPVLNNTVIPLKLGYVGIINRSQQDIVDNKPIKKALEDERKFFETHKAYKTVAERCGVPYLARTLNRLLLQHITSFLPTLRARLIEMRDDAQNELMRCGPELVGESVSARQTRLLDIITKTADAFKRGLDVDEETDVTELQSGARIHFIFEDVFGAHVASIDPLSGVAENDIKTCLHNAAGTRPALFIAEAAFELLARRQIEMLREPALQAVDLVHEELRRVAGSLDVAALQQFSSLQDAVSVAFKDHLSVCAERCKRTLNHIVDVELAFINIKHPDFVGASEVTERMLKESMRNKYKKEEDEAAAAGTDGAKKAKKGKAPAFASSQKKASKQSAVPTLRRVPGQIRAGSYQTEKEKFEIDVIKTLLISYFDIVRKNMRDLVPKSIMLFVVQASQKQIQNVLVQELFDTEKASKLLEEPEELTMQRKDAKALVELISEALKTLSQLGSHRAAGSRGGPSRLTFNSRF